MENYTISLIDKNFKYQSDILEFFIANKSTINQYEDIFYSHNLDTTNLFLKELKHIFTIPKFKSKQLVKISEDFYKGDLIVLEVDFKMIKYKAEESSKILLQENNLGNINQFTNLLALLEPSIESLKHYALKFSSSGMQKLLVESIKND